MTEALFSNIDESCEVLKLDFSSGEFAAFCEKNAFSPETIRGIELLLEHLRKNPYLHLVPDVLVFIGN